LLIADLGVRRDILNMNAHAQVWDPMSLGAWAVGVFGLFSFVFLVMCFGRSSTWRGLRRRIGLIGMLFGFSWPATTGVLLSADGPAFLE